MEKSKDLSLNSPIRLRGMEAKIIRLAFMPVVFIQFYLLISIGFDLISALEVPGEFTHGMVSYILYSMGCVVLISALMTFYVMTLYAYYCGSGGEPLDLFRAARTRMWYIISGLRLLFILLMLGLMFTGVSDLVELKSASLFIILLASELMWWSLNFIVRHLYVSEIIETAVVEHGFRGNE
jgi:hypothetical protein